MHLLQFSSRKKQFCGLLVKGNEQGSCINNVDSKSAIFNPIEYNGRQFVKIWLSMPRIMRIFLNKNLQFTSTFFVKNIFDKYWNTLYSKSRLNFWRTVIRCIQWFPWPKILHQINSTTELPPLSFNVVYGCTPAANLNFLYTPRKLNDGYYYAAQKTETENWLTRSLYDVSHWDQNRFEVTFEFLMESFSEKMLLLSSGV